MATAEYTAKIIPFPSRKVVEPTLTKSVELALILAIADALPAKLLNRARATAFRMELRSPCYESATAALLLSQIVAGRSV